MNIHTPSNNARRRLRPRRAFSLGLTALALGALTQTSLAGSPERMEPPRVSQREALSVYANQALAFVPNAGQADTRIHYTAQGPGFAFALRSKDVLLRFVQGQRSATLVLRFLGANANVALESRDQLPGKVHYLLGKDPAGWHTGVSRYAEVVYRNVWPGIDLAFHGRSGALKYEFRVAPRANVSDIQLAYRGADGLALGRAGDLAIRTSLGILRDSKPVSYQTIGGRRVPVESRYLLDERRGQYSFAVGAYDRRYPVVIDPGYSTYLGGSEGDLARGIAVDDAGAVYVIGSTSSVDFPTTWGSFKPTSNYGPVDVFVTKLNRDGTGQVYSTYLGGGGSDRAGAIAVDGAGNAYVTGITDSVGFPASPGAFDTSFNGVFDMFVAKLNPAGTGLVYSTFLGGSDEEGYAGDNGQIAVDAAGSAYVTGDTLSTTFPKTHGAFDTSFNPPADVFVTKLNPQGTALIYSTFLGSCCINADRAGTIALDTSGHAYVTGRAGSSNFPTTPGAFDTSFNGDQDAYVTKLNPQGTGLVYSTFLGGSDGDAGTAIVVDGGRRAYVTGVTESANFPVSATTFDATFNGGDGDVFVANLNAEGTGLLYSSYIGGSGYEWGWDIAVDDTGSVYLTGVTDSMRFPTTANALDTTSNGNDDVFVTKLNPKEKGLAYSTFLGGSELDWAFGIAFAGAGSVYVTGDTRSANFPTSAGAFDRIFQGTGDAFISKLDLAVRGCPPLWPCLP